MKDVARFFSMGLTVSLAAAGVFTGSPVRAASPCAPAPASDNMPPAGARDWTYPTFCSIPLRPRGERTPEAFKAAVVDTRMAGAWLVRRTAPETFSLSGGEAFADEARRQAEPPPPMTSPGDVSTDAFIEESRARATPPSRPH
jgi:hypothetical protein